MCTAGPVNSSVTSYSGRGMWRYYLEFNIPNDDNHFEGKKNQNNANKVLETPMLCILTKVSKQTNRHTPNPLKTILYYMHYCNAEHCIGINLSLN